LVDYYGIEFDSGPEEKPPDDGLLIWNVGDDHQPWPVKDESHKALIAEIEELLKDEEAPHDTLFDCYKRLPTPGVAYLKKDTIRALLHHLSIVERPDEVSMQRFLSILDDMKDAHIHILRSEWTSAIRFAGRFMGKVSTEQLHSALYLWRDMEKRAGIKGGAVTLNVLFDVAVRAGNYSLAESFLKEMRARKLKIHRHFRVSLIFYFGVMQNGNAVRRAYKELVEAGDVVDTVVMNAVISALIRAGEPAAAEHVFERMKRLHASKSGAKEPPRYWRERRLLGLRLTYDGRNFTESGEKDKHKDLQAEAPIAPDSRTYGLIIRQHAAEAGNIDRVEELIKEMQYNQVPIDGTVYVVILYGFASFGGVRYSSWTREKLEPLWQGYLASVKAGADRTWLSTTAVIAALKAFSKCTDEQRTLQVWEEARLVWDPTPEEREQVLKVLRALVPDHPFFDFN
jgi:pentatricopeptide repeat protein